MKKFVAIYTGVPAMREKWNQMPEATRKQREQEGIKAWKDWMMSHHEVIVDIGGPLGKTKRVSPQGISDIKNTMTGYVVLNAESHDAVAKLFEKHPHFTIFPGEAVEIMEVLAIPGP